MFAGYMILRVLGAGGMETVYLGCIRGCRENYAGGMPVDQVWRSRSFRRWTAQYPLPQPSQDPITLLTGHGHLDENGPRRAR